MKVTIIGSGNVATVMGSTIVQAGHSVLQVAARNGAAAAELAAQWGCDYTTQWEAIGPSADLYIVSLSDRALPELNAGLRLPGRLVVHTAGAAPLSALASVSERYGVLYPLQSLRKEVRPFPEFPLLIDAARPEDLMLLDGFARTLARQVQRADDALRLKLHVAAIFANNFTNYLYTLSADFCRREGIDGTLLLPLIRETAERVERYDPRTVQTGPAIRGDRATMERHLEVLAKYHNMNELYRIISGQISEYYK
ncbi:MAG TPA: Rossmann-like and DUF2520 domain-containing protein [Puia sp.]|uniref:Rossmann-like and DUF2520 domain-containing protein n=1 Tax=Puia sp. TaxID=2045100 RepID=UPI002B5ADA92|nr:Rossmann-like and DUF2520 domain-containing protein [Puia sp.]HVU96201.1 Rossmann-like and DUF2520 domain-containing protein [Puia sp.]